jgi:acyl-CoA thioester hydrolase
MFLSETEIRVRYADTDQMGVVYYGNYAMYYEVGRAESIRQLGYTYKDMEAMGVYMPVVEMHFRFLRPALYDDLLKVKTTLRELPTHHKIEFHTEIFNEAGELLNAGRVVLFFMDSATKKRCSMPASLLEKLAPHF